MQADLGLHFVKEVLKQGTEIRTQAQLLMVTQPLLARVCTTVENTLPSINLYLELEPREEVKTRTRGSKPKYGDSLMMCEPQQARLGEKDTFDTSVTVEEESGEDGSDDVENDDDDELSKNICIILYMGAASPVLLHEVDVNATMEKLVTKGLDGVGHLMDDFKVDKLILLVTHQSGITKVIECHRKIAEEPLIYPVSSREFGLISDAASVEPKLNTLECTAFFNYLSECVHDLVVEVHQ